MHATVFMCVHVCVCARAREYGGRAVQCDVGRRTYQSKKVQPRVLVDALDGLAPDGVYIARNLRVKPQLKAVVEVM
jgi:hypothetical protein